MWEIITHLICFIFNEENIQKTFRDLFFIWKNNKNWGSLGKCFSLEKQEKTMVKNRFVFFMGKQTKTHSIFRKRTVDDFIQCTHIQM